MQSVKNSAGPAPSLLFLHAHFPWMLMIALITIESALTGKVLVELAHGLDKFVHFMIFGVLGWLLMRGCSLARHEILKKGRLWWTPLAGGVFAMLDELHQALVPGRYPDVKDWLADFSGIVVFMLLYYFLKKDAKNPASDRAGV